MFILGKKINFSVIFWILFYLLVFLIVLKNSYGYLDADLGWHLKVGENIMQSGEIVRDNFYNYTFTGNWVNHEWLIDIFSYWIFNNLGYFALSFFFALVVLIILILLNQAARRLLVGASDIPIAIFQLLGLFACLPHFGVRMQEFGILFFLVELLIINFFRKEKKIKILFWLLPLFLLWANIHGSFLFGLTVLAAFLLIIIIERLLFKYNSLNQYFIINKFEAKSFLIGFLLLALSIVVTLGTPYKLELYYFLEGYKNTAYLNLIQEWLPLFAFPVDYYKLIYLGFLSGVWLVFIYEVVKHKQSRIDLWQFFLFIILLIASFKSKRNFPLLFVATFPAFISMLTNLFNWEVFYKVYSQRLIKSLIIFCIILSSVSLWAATPFKPSPFTGFCNDYPCQAVDFLRTNSELNNYNIFNEYGWGGYLIWAYPEKKLFIDGRLPQVNFAGHTFIEEYSEFFKEEVDKRAKFEQYDIRLVLLRSYDKPINISRAEKFFFRIKDLEVKNHLRVYLNESADWNLVYQDKVASVYVRK